MSKLPHNISGCDSSVMDNDTHKTDGNEPTQEFEVEVPNDAQPGQPFHLMAGGVRVLVTCPLNARPGQCIKFKLPTKYLEGVRTKVKINYRKDGWVRRIDPMDVSFRWERVDDKGDVIEMSKRFDPATSAYVRKLEFMEGEDPRIRIGVLSLAPASEVLMDSKVKGRDGSTVARRSDFAEAQVKSFDDKKQWLHDKFNQLRVEWQEGHMRLILRRQFLLADSIDSVMSLTRKDLRKSWRFHFMDETRVREEGLAQEWFQFVTKEVFHPETGLWQSSVVNKIPNPASALLCEDHLVYYRFLGRVMGKALLDGELVAGHMAPYMYKHILGWPITWNDLEAVDEELYTHLNQLVDMVHKGEDISKLRLNFTTTKEIMGIREEIEVIENGKDMAVTANNFPEYLEACLKYRMLDCIKPQLNELLLGFFDVIPQPLLTVLDYEELELLLCGFPDIDIQDWKENTEYSGEFDNVGGDHIICQWFWEVVAEFDDEMKARLLQFATGSFALPSGGFGVLRTKDGNVKKFTIHGVPLEVCLYPRAQTSLNRIDLPLYESLDELREKLTLAVKKEAPVENE